MPEILQPMRSRLLNARLITLLMVLRSSAELVHNRTSGIAELQRRLLSLIGDHERLTSIELVALTGQEKAQISRAVAALSAADLVERPSLRAPIRLSAAGGATFDQLMVIARQRNAAVTRGIAAEELARFAATTERLTVRAAQLLAHEREISSAAQEEDFADDPSPLPEQLCAAAGKRPLSQMIVPPLITLNAYLSRSATIAYRRETGLSLFSWQTFSQIGEHAPITLSGLIALVYRDKSQVGRAVGWLEREGIVARGRLRGRRDVLLRCTGRGEALYAEMCRSALRRDDYLFADVAPTERQAYIATIEKLTGNAGALLTQERAAAAG